MLAQRRPTDLKASFAEVSLCPKQCLPLRGDSAVSFGQLRLAHIPEMLHWVCQECGWELDAQVPTGSETRGHVLDLVPIISSAARGAGGACFWALLALWCPWGVKGAPV